MAEDGGQGMRDDPEIVVRAKPRGFEEIFQFFVKQFASGRLKPGDRLLPERDLAQALEVSRPSLREAMRAMALLGLIDIRPGQGTFVRPPNMTVLYEFFSIMLSFNPGFHQNAVLIRQAIECQAARTACRTARPEDFEAMRQALDELGRTEGDPEAWGEAEVAFHAAVVRATHDDVMIFVYESLMPLIRRDHEERRRIWWEAADGVPIMVARHRDVLEAIAAGDSDQAEERMHWHFRMPDEISSFLPEDVGGKSGESRGSARRSKASKRKPAGAKRRSPG